MKRILGTGILVAIISLAMFVIPSSTMPNSHAVLTGTVCAFQFNSLTDCPTAPPNIVATAGSDITVTIFISGSDALNGVDMSVMTDPTILNPTTISFCTGTTYCNSPPVTSVVAANPLVLIDCINGAPVAGSGAACNSYDGNGIASVGLLNLGGSTIAPTSGLIFTVTYHVISTTPAAVDVLVNPNCAGQSVAGANDCILVTNGAAVDPEIALAGAPVNGVTDANAMATVNNVITTVDPTSTSVACSPSTVAITQRSSCTATVTDTMTPSEIPGGSITFTLTAGTTGGSLSSSTCTLSSGSCSVTFSGTAPGTATVNATYSGEATHDPSAAHTLATITVVLDKTATTVPNTSCNIATGATSCAVNVTATVTDLNVTSNTPTGTVTFNLTPGSTGGSLNSSTCSLSAGSCFVKFNATSTGSASITASYGGDSIHDPSTSAAATIDVFKGSNFALSVRQTSLTMVVGTSTTFNLTITSINGFNSPVELTNSTTPTIGVALMCSPNPATPPADLSVNSTCTISASSAGSYSVTITGTSASPALTNSLPSPITVTVAKATPTISTKLNATETVNGRPVITVGDSLYDNATISGGYYATGLVTFNVFITGNCAGTPFPTSETISNHVLAVFPPTSFITAANQSISATYQGDGNNTATAPSACEPFIVNANPIASISVASQPIYKNQSIDYYLKGVELAFNSTGSSDPDSSILNDKIISAAWIFGDGSNPVFLSYKTLANHTYTAPGNYTVTLKVTDEYGGTNSTSHKVIVIVPEVTIVSYHLSTATATVGDGVTLTVDVLNNGLIPITFNMTMGVLSPSSGIAQTVDQQQLSLNPNQEDSSVTLHWNTTGFSPQTYTVVIGLVNAKINGPNGTPTSLTTTSQGAGSLALSAQTGFELPGGNILWIIVGVVAAVVIVVGTILFRRRRKPSV